MPYSKKVLDRFEQVTNNPAAHGVGRFDPNDPNVATGLTGAPACGDVMKLDIKLNPDTEVIEDVKFKTYGCGSAIASSSLFVDMLIGKTIHEAKEIKDKEIERYVHFYYTAVRKGRPVWADSKSALWRRSIGLERTAQRRKALVKLGVGSLKKKGRFLWCRS